MEHILKLFMLLVVCSAVLFLTGCASTHSTVTEFDSAGNIVKQLESSESVIKTVMESTANKSVIIWEDGWAGYISISSGTIEDPAPHGKIYAGKTNKGWISLLPDQRGTGNISKIIQATKSDVAISLEGITSSSSSTQLLKSEQTVPNGS